MAERIMAILEEFNECAEMKKHKLQNCRNSLPKRYSTGQTASVLNFISQHLARDSADGIFVGAIEDYMQDGQLLALEDLCKSIDIQIEVC